jgi:hypothetical protein
MENEANNANNDMVEQEESTGSAPCQVFSGRNPKRLRSKVWDDFTPIYIDGKVTRAECMHCHQVFNNNGTSKLLKHQAKCNPSAQKTRVQQKLPFLLTGQNKSSDATDHVSCLAFLPTRIWKVRRLIRVFVTRNL